MYLLRTILYSLTILVRQRYISATCGMAILRDVPQEVMFRVLIERINIVTFLPWLRAAAVPRENQLYFVMAGNDRKQWQVLDRISWRCLQQYVYRSREPWGQRLEQKCLQPLVEAGSKTCFGWVQLLVVLLKSWQWTDISIHQMSKPLSPQSSKNALWPWRDFLYLCTFDLCRN